MTNPRFKFRVFNNDAESWRYMDLLQNTRITLLESDDLDSLSQFTGLFDCEGREIWEDDIVSLRGYHSYPMDGQMKTTRLDVMGLVEYCAADAQWFVTRANGASKTQLGGYRSWEVETRVIGNRFESLELFEIKE